MEINWSDIVSLLVSVVLGGIIGCERESHEKPAGLRTNILICLGACLFTIISMHLCGSDPGRIAAQIVTGIGFLGAGAIIHSGIGIHGLTTAAGIWIVAGIGMACGAGMYVLAVCATLLTMIALLLFAPLEKRLGKEHHEKQED